MTQRSQYFVLEGGLDLVTPALKIKPGRIISGMNYEPVAKGYHRVDGYERLDGRPKPSEASYWVLNFDAGTAGFLEGETVTGGTSGATGVVLFDAVVESGSYGGGDAAGYVVLTGVSGDFADNEAITSASGAATADGEDVEKGAANDTDHNSWLQDAIETARSNIQAVPGSGPVRGVWDYKGDRYAFRDNAGGTACVMHKATTSGWAAQDLGLELSFRQLGLVTPRNVSLGIESLKDANGDGTPRDLIFKPDGTKMYVVVDSDTVSDPGGSKVYQFDLSTAWDLSTAVNSGNSVDIAANDLTPKSAYFKPDGQRLYVAGLPKGMNTADIAIYELSTPWDLSTATFNSYFDSGAERGVGTTSTDAIFFKPDGKRFYLYDLGDTIYQFSLTDAWDLTTASYDTVSFDTNTVFSGTKSDSLKFSPDGEKLFLCDRTASGEQLQQLDLTTGWDLSTAAFNGVAVDPLESGSVIGFAFNDEGSRIFIVKGTVSSEILEFGLSSPWSLDVLLDPNSLITGVDDGDTITGDESGATAVVKRVAVESGSWQGYDAVGRFVFASQTGTFDANEKITVGSQAGLARVFGDSDAITLPPGGRYHFDNYNFFGTSDDKRMYGVNGVGYGFEWDGSIFVPIRTGMASDTPTRVQGHRNHLFFAFPGGSVQHSSIGKPYEWSVITGAGEIGIGDDVTDMLASVSGVLALFARNKVAALFGSDAASWDLRTLSDDSGVEAWTAQMIGIPVYLGLRGVGSMETTEQFGDFILGTLTQLVEPIFEAKRKAGRTPAGSLRVRSKDQYRILWDDGTGLTLYFGRRPVECMTFDLNVNVACTASVKDDSGQEWLLMGADDGFVYEIDAGTSFDGSEIEAFARLAFNHVGSPAQNKRWMKGTIEFDGGPITELGVAAEYAYASPNLVPGQSHTYSIGSNGGFWNEIDWDNFYWSGPVVGEVETHLEGIGQNLSLLVVSNATYEQPHTLTGVTLNFSYRGVRR